MLHAEMTRIVVVFQIEIELRQIRSFIWIFTLFARIGRKKHIHCEMHRVQKFKLKNKWEQGWHDRMKKWNEFDDCSPCSPRKGAQSKNDIKKYFYVFFVAPLSESRHQMCNVQFAVATLILASSVFSVQCSVSVHLFHSLFALFFFYLFFFYYFYFIIFGFHFSFMVFFLSLSRSRFGVFMPCAFAVCLQCTRMYVIAASHVLVICLGNLFK